MVQQGRKRKGRGKTERERERETEFDGTFIYTERWLVGWFCCRQRLSLTPPHIINSILSLFYPLLPFPPPRRVPLVSLFSINASYTIRVVAAVGMKEEEEKDERGRYKDEGRVEMMEIPKRRDPQLGGQKRGRLRPFIRYFVYADRKKSFYPFFCNQVTITDNKLLPKLRRRGSRGEGEEEMGNLQGVLW